MHLYACSNSCLIIDNVICQRDWLITRCSIMLISNLPLSLEALIIQGGSITLITLIIPVVFTNILESTLSAKFTRYEKKRNKSITISSSDYFIKYFSLEYNIHHFSFYIPNSLNLMSIIHLSSVIFLLKLN